MLLIKTLASLLGVWVGALIPSLAEKLPYCRRPDNYFLEMEKLHVYTSTEKKKKATTFVYLEIHNAMY